MVLSVAGTALHQVFEPEAVALPSHESLEGMALPVAGQVDLQLHYKQQARTQLAALAVAAGTRFPEAVSNLSLNSWTMRLCSASSERSASSLCFANALSLSVIERLSRAMRSR